MLELLRSDLAIAMLSGLLFVSVILYSKSDCYRYGLYAYVSFLILGFMAIVMVGFRPLDAGNDTMGYAHAFSRLTDITTAYEVGMAYYGNQEFLFWSFSALLKMLINSPSVYILAVALLSFLIVVCCVYFASRKELGNDYYFYPTLCLCLYFTYALVYTGNHVRASIAVPLCIFSLVLFYYKYYKSSAVLFVLSIGFHVSTASALPAFFLLYTLPEDKAKLRIYAILIISASFVMSFVYQLVLQYIPLSIAGVDMETKLNLYYTETFAIQSVFKALTFWVITLNILMFIFLGVKKIHFIAIYYYGMALFLSPIPIMSERYFLYILILLPFLLYISLRERLSTKNATIALASFYSMSGILMILSPGAKYTLALTSYL